MDKSNQEQFDCIIRSHVPLAEIPVSNLADLIFKKLDYRDENSEIILSHDNFQYIRISLRQYRALVLQLYLDFIKKGFKPGNTILLASIPGNNECFLAILFSALASFGMRVFLPMFTESVELDNWVEMTHCQIIIYPSAEIFSLKHHEKEKRLINEIKQCANKHQLPLFDTLTDFNLRKLIHDRQALFFEHEPIIKDVTDRTNEHTEALIITTSGSSGKSKLVIYEQGAFLRSCASWQRAGFFEKHLFGCRGFTPLFTHTMGIRSFFNALWSGHPICLLNTEWFTEKPEAIRYFLKQMKPEHITGGPAAFQLLLEMMRVFPDMISELKAHMKTVISSGAPIQSEVISKVESFLNVPVHNAFGTTETQQVLNTLLIPDASREDSISMGLPLPGVTIGLKRYSGDNLYRMYIRSPFGCKRILGDEPLEINRNAYFCTGDIVRYEKDRLYYVGRENRDFLKDGFGVKAALMNLKDFYKDVLEACDHIEFLPLLHEPGLAALIFTQKKKAGPIPSRAKSRQFFKQIIEKTNDKLFQELDSFTYRHHTLRRFAVVSYPVPLTAKGNISRQQIMDKYRDLISDLVGVFPNRKKVELLTVREDTSDPFTRHVNPYVGEMLHALKMDYVYHRSQKDSLFSYQDQREVEILDMTGGYGTNLLGHNNPDVKKAVIDFLDSDRISLSNQGSIQTISGRLAEKLNLMTGQSTGKRFQVCFGSSGAEIMEMALHHACLEWRQRVKKFQDHQVQHYSGRAGKYLRNVWEYDQEKIQKCKLHVVVSASGFHGHTSGARSLLRKSEKREAFSNLLSLIPIYVDDRNPNWRVKFEAERKKACITLHKIVSKNGEWRIVDVLFSTIIAAIFEPITGEGGIRCVNRDVLDFFSDQEFPLIIDEIQCGLGRAGTFLASEGIPAHYYLFAKALGGGIEKIGALLIDSSRYQKEFGKYYSSTFANGELASYTALKTLEIIQKDNIPQISRERGDKMHVLMKRIQKQYPDVISNISGKGLMQGIRFVDFSTSDNLVLRMLSQNEMLGYLCASYLLHNHGIRILPSLSASNVLRIEPSAYISIEEIERFCNAIQDLTETIRKRSLYRLCKHLMDGDEFDDNKGKEPANGYFYTGMEPPARGAVKVTFIGHFAYPVDELRGLEKDFCRASDTGLRILSNRIQGFMEMKPIIIFQKNIFHSRVHFTCMIIPLDSAALERMHREGKRRRIISKIQKAVDLAAALGSRVISLGGYISILTNNGMAVSAPENVKVITGNTLTAASGLKRVLQAMEAHDFLRKKNVVAILGIPGNIGSILAEQLLQKKELFSEVILIGRTKKKLNNFYENLCAEIEIPSDITVQLETDLGCLRRCDVVLISTNTNDPIIFRHHIRQTEKVLISDNSVPAAVSEEVISMPNVISLPFASYIQLPYDPDFLISTYTPRGTLFCCAAEAVLCALEKVDVPLRGKITGEAVEVITRLADKHGFFASMGAIKSFKTAGVV